MCQSQDIEQKHSWKITWSVSERYLMPHLRPEQHFLVLKVVALCRKCLMVPYSTILPVTRTRYSRVVFCVDCMHTTVVMNHICLQLSWLQ